MGEAERRQRSKEFGIQLAKLLVRRAEEARGEGDLDPRYVVLGAAEYLGDRADFQIDPPLDLLHADAADRSN
jgi:hypothetical protein